MPGTILTLGGGRNRRFDSLGVLCFAGVEADPCGEPSRRFQTNSIGACLIFTVETDTESKGKWVANAFCPRTLGDESTGKEYESCARLPTCDAAMLFLARAA
jgi:hypothetical protein